MGGRNKMASDNRNFFYFKTHPQMEIKQCICVEVSEWGNETEYLLIYMLLHSFGRKRHNGEEIKETDGEKKVIGSFY